MNTDHIKTTGILAMDSTDKPHWHEWVVKPMSKQAVDFAIKHKINLRQDWNGYYMVIKDGAVLAISLYPTGKSAICMMKKYLR
jgi:hypothetical protein